MQSVLRGGSAARALTAALGLATFAAACGGRIAADMREEAPSENTEAGAGHDSASEPADREPAGEVPPSDTASSDRAEASDTEGSPSDASTVADVDDTADDAMDDGVWCGDVRAFPECVAYQSLLATCLDTETGFACEDHVRPTPDADWDATRALRADNLNRLQVACR